jgi:hypothetical protein
VSEFHLVDLISQRDAVRAHLRGKSAEEIVEWLSRRGRLDRWSVEDRDHYCFETVFGRQAIFFFDEGDLVFIGDHTTFR